MRSVHLLPHPLSASPQRRRQFPASFYRIRPERLHGKSGIHLTPAWQSFIGPMNGGRQRIVVIPMDRVLGRPKEVSQTDITAIRRPGLAPSMVAPLDRDEIRIDTYETIKDSRFRLGSASHLISGRLPIPST